jgi:hypothetical protein
MPHKDQRRPGGGGAATSSGKSKIVYRNTASSKTQAGFIAAGASVTPEAGTCGAFAWSTEPRVRACLSCGEPGVTGLCTACIVERVLDRIAEGIAERAAEMAEAEDPSAERLPVREHLRPRPSRLRCSRPELEVAGIWTRQPERCVDGWFWEQTSGVPAPYAEVWATRGNA